MRGCEHEIEKKLISDLKVAVTILGLISHQMILSIKNLNKAITTFGFVQPPVWNQRTGNVSAATNGSRSLWIWR